MVLSQDQTALARQFDLGLIRENPCSRRHHVALEPKDGLEDLVPNFERNPGVVFGLAGLPARQNTLLNSEDEGITLAAPGVAKDDTVLSHHNRKLFNSTDMV